MERVPSPKDLRGAAAVARTLAYVVGLVGVVGGAVLYRGAGALGAATAVWVITFAAGALMMIAGFLCDGLAALLARTAAIEHELRALRRGTPPDLPGETDEPGPPGHANPW